jgi:geranylgeranyl diphosphate synthase type II
MANKENMKSSFDVHHFDQALLSALDRHTSKCPRNLYESMRYTLALPGKRIRPHLTMACAEMIGLDKNAALPAAIAVEAIHCFTLIHDDLPCMDNDDFRRGKPSNHKVFGEGMALLAGDSLFAFGLQALNDALGTAAPSNVLNAIRTLLAAIGPEGVVGGQAAEALLKTKGSFEEVLTVHHLKTGKLFSASLLMPCELHGFDQGTPAYRSIDYFAKTLGIAFQISDDLEDFEKVDIGPENVLKYKSREDLIKFSQSELRLATDTLKSSYGEHAHDLVRISDKVLSSF